MYTQVDSYGHFFRVLRTKVQPPSLEPAWNEEFMVDLEGSENLRLLVYQVHTYTVPTVYSLEPAWNEEFMVDLEGSENLRLLVYQVPYVYS